MDKIDPVRIREILTDAEFLKLTTQMMDRLENVAMSLEPADVRDNAWRDYHALKRVLARMANVAQDAKTQG